MKGLRACDSGGVGKNSAYRVKGCSVITMQDATDDPLRYDQMLQRALRGVLRETLSYVAAQGLPGNHHLYITFGSQAPGVEIPDYLLASYPNDMTIVLQHEFWGLELDETGFKVTLSFNNRHERLVVPFAAVTAFADPSVQFGLQFESGEGSGEAGGDANLPMPLEGEESASTPTETGETAEADTAETAEEDDGKVVALDRFRKRDA